jgi:hypothetical protein
MRSGRVAASIVIALPTFMSDARAQGQSVADMRLPLLRGDRIRVAEDEGVIIEGLYEGRA